MSSWPILPPRGGYILRDTAGTPDAIIIATGSEVGLAMDSAEVLAAEGKQVRVVSMPCTDLFDKQDAAYREAVLLHLLLRGLLLKLLRRTTGISMLV